VKFIEIKKKQKGREITGDRRMGAMVSQRRGLQRRKTGKGNLKCTNGPKRKKVQKNRGGEEAFGK